MKKTLYIIKNTINDMVYIGQTIDVIQRWYKHICEAKNRTIYPLHKAMKEFGIDKFYYQILEMDVENANEREVYWINYYNSVYPNGYNLSGGGAGSGEGINNKYAKFNSLNDIYEIIGYLKNTKMSIEKIAEIYQCKSEIISAINTGRRYKIEGISYPIRWKKYQDDILKMIRYSLKYELDKTLIHIAKEYNIDLSQLSEINSGKIYRIDSENYPLRKGKVCNPAHKYLDEIIKMLKDENITKREIMKKFNISYITLQCINNGKSYRKDNEEYPIRKTSFKQEIRKSLSLEEVRKIEKMIMDGEAFDNIAILFECASGTIKNINNGRIPKYINPSLNYPIRPIKKRNKQ